MLIISRKLGLQKKKSRNKTFVYILLVNFKDLNNKLDKKIKKITYCNLDFKLKCKR